MANKNIHSAEQIEIIDLLIEAPGRYKFNTLDAQVNLAGVKNSAPSAVQFTFYEDIFKPYLTGDLLLLDQNNLLSRLNILGTERVTIRYVEPGLESDIISKSFVITSIEQQSKNTDGEKLVSLELIEDFGYFNYLTTINKGYSGKAEEIIDKIHKSEIGKYLLPQFDQESYQNKMTYIAPWVKPYEATRRVLSQMTTENGMPFFLYSTMNSKYNVLTDLESIVKRGSFNAGQPFTYSVALSALDRAELESKSLQVSEYEEDMVSNTALLATMGGISSRLEIVDASTAELTIDSKTFIDIKKEVENLDEQVIGKNQKLIIIDFISRFLDTDQANKSLTEYVSAVKSKITSRTTDKSKKIPQSEWVDGFNEPQSIASSKLYAIRASVLYHLISNSVKINVPGFLFSANSIRTTVGNLLDFQIFNANVQNIDAIDETKSGKFLILRKRHAIDLIDQLHTVSIEMTKMADLDNSEV